MENNTDVKTQAKPIKNKTIIKDKDEDYTPKLFIEESIQLEDEHKKP